MEDLPVILVVEDDEQIQTVVEDALTEGGFEPAIAPSGEEAVTLLRGNKGSYRALVADIGLRGRMDGWEVARHARELDPEFPIVYMTGIRKDEWGSRGVPNSILMTKPFAPAQLVTGWIDARRWSGRKCNWVQTVAASPIPSDHPDIRSGQAWRP